MVGSFLDFSHWYSRASTLSWIISIRRIYTEMAWPQIAFAWTSFTTIRVGVLCKKFMWSTTRKSYFPCMIIRIFTPQLLASGHLSPGKWQTLSISYKKSSHLSFLVSHQLVLHCHYGNKLINAPIVNFLHTLHRVCIFHRNQPELINWIYLEVDTFHGAPITA